MTRRGLSHWIPILARFSAGQAAILAVNLVTGLLVLRFLSLTEYAVYILASVLQNLASLGADLGMSQGVVSIGAPIREDKAAFGDLVGGAVRLRKKLFLAVSPVVIALAYVVLRGNRIDLGTGLIVTALALGLAWVQQSSSIAAAVLNANHDSTGLLRTGAATAIARLLLIVGMCSMAPYAVTAIVANLIGTTIQTWLIWRRCDRYIDRGAAGQASAPERLTRFMKPLFPGIVYYLVQGHISIFLLSLVGTTSSIAEVGALGRLGQIIGILTLLNGFFVQPYFARIDDRHRFATRASQMFAVLLVSFLIITASAVVAPQAWLLILGAKYETLANELVLALIGAQLSVIGAILYTMVIATRRTEGQWLQIALGIAAQALFLAFFEVKDTRSALLLNMLPAATYVVLQSGILVRVMLTWDRSTRHA